MPRAAIHFPWRPPFNAAVFGEGLKRLGYKIASVADDRPNPGDLLVLWNRRPRHEHLAKRYESAGATVLVVENGYLGRNWKGGPWYALARGDHNGVGRLPPDDCERARSLDLELQPWRDGGNEIVILAQRGIGSAAGREPEGWADAMLSQVRARSDRPVRIRRHPGPQGSVPKVSLADDLADAFCAVTWASSAGLRAILMGVPVFHGLEPWIGAPAARPVMHDLADPYRGDRGALLARLAGAMWRSDEIASGEPFARLLS